MLPTLSNVRLPQIAVERTAVHAQRIRMQVRTASPALTTACRQAGLPLDLAELCGGLLATVADDLIEASRLSRTDFERAKRIERVLAATEEPALQALRIAIAASPINGRACARHWDAICEHGERGKLAWLIGLDTDTAYKYSKKMQKRG